MPKIRNKRSSTPLGGGLPSVAQARRDRRRKTWLPPSFWLWAILFISAGIIVWWRMEESRIQSARNELLAKQRAVVAELGPRWYPLRDKIEKWSQECGGELKPAVDPAAGKSWDFRKMPGIYLRLSQEVTITDKSIREAANLSLHDAFTSCLLLTAQVEPTAGPRCHTTAECAPGQLCNDFRHCASHSQPFNLRIAYQSLHVMSDEWVTDIQGITKHLTVRGAAATFEDVARFDLPVATELLQRAEYFMVVVDEAPVEKPAAEKGEPGASAELDDTRDRSISSEPHQARVCVWRLSDDKRMLAVVGNAAGELVGGPAETNSRTRDAMRHQANSCALALDVREAMGLGAGAKVPSGE